MDPLAAIFRRQHGLVTRHQARADGHLSPNQIAYRLATGEWVAAERAVYRLAAVPVTWRQRLLAACLACAGVASHRSAAALWGLDGFRAGRVEITVARGRRRRSRAGQVHESTQWDLREATSQDGVPVTGVGRTLLDLAGVVPYRRFEDAVDAALRMRRTSWEALAEVYVLHRRRGRPGGGPMRALLSARCGDQAIPLSSWSRGVQRLLLDAGLPAALLEHEVHDAQGHVATVDLAYPASLVAIELQSVRWHHNLRSFHRDPDRRNRLLNVGWRVYEFTWADYVDRPAALCETVRSAIWRRST